MHYSLHYNVALVSVKTSCAISLPVLRHGSENLCFKLVAAVGRFFKSGDLKASVGKLYPHWSGPFDFQRLLYSTCKIKKVMLLIYLCPHLNYGSEYICRNTSLTSMLYYK
jgi:hypothetical protein